MIKKITVVLSLLNKEQISKNKTKNLFQNKNIFIINFEALKSTKRENLLNYFKIKSRNILIMFLNQE